MKKEEIRTREALKLVEMFNNKFPVGSKVQLRKIATDSCPYVDCYVRAEAFVIHGDAVAYFVGISGYFSIEKDFIKY